MYRRSADVERLALQPGLEARRRQQVVEPHRELEALLRREERIHGEHADLLQRRLLDVADQAGEVEVAPVLPGVVEKRRDTRMCSRLVSGSASMPSEREQARGRGLHALAVELGVVAERGRARRSARSTESGRPAVLPGV